MSKLVKKSLYASGVYQECIDRIERLSENTYAQWGAMDAAQMISHCAEVLEVMNGKDLRNTPFMVKLFKPLIRHVVVNDKAYSNSMKTHPQYMQNTERVFEFEKRRFLQALEDFINHSSAETNEISHPLFGKMSVQEKGWSMYKHLDHHLRQFAS
jgi:hypothetical protein